MQCSECLQDFDPGTRGRGALTCSDACARARANRLDRGRYRVDKIAAEALEAVRKETKARWVACKASACGRLVRNITRASGYCERCELEARDRKLDVAEDSQAHEDAQALMAWHELVRKRAPAGRAWWWR